MELKTISFDFNFNKSLCVVEYDTGNSTYLGAARLTLFQDIPNLQVNMTIISKKQKNFSFERNINACFFAKQRKSNLFFRFIFDDVFKYANFRFECPFKKVSWSFGSRIPSRF